MIEFEIFTETPIGDFVAYIYYIKTDFTYDIVYQKVDTCK